MKRMWKCMIACIIFIICVITVSSHSDFVKAFIDAQIKGVQNADTQILKRGYYFGE